jgi:hypothetical protein
VVEVVHDEVEVSLPSGGWVTYTVVTVVGIVATTVTTLISSDVVVDEAEDDADAVSPSTAEVSRADTVTVSVA